MQLRTSISHDKRGKTSAYKVQIRYGADTIDAGSYQNEHVARMAAARAEAEIIKRLRRETPIDQFLLRTAPERKQDPMRRQHYVTA